MRIISLRFILFETAFIGTYFESKCAEVITSLDYEDSKYLESSAVMTDLNLVATFTSGIIQNFLQSLSSLFLVLSITTYLLIYGSKLYLLILGLVLIFYLIIGNLSVNKLSRNSKRAAKFQKKRTAAINYLLRIFRQLLLNEKQRNTIASIKASVKPLYINSASGAFITLFQK